jgi:hypothetical protein
MSSSTSPYFFISYSREDKTLQERVVRELRERGVNVWVDIENLIPGTPAWEREIEQSIRNSAGVVVLLSPGSNNSEWVRREISFAEENDKPIFPVHIRGDENDSIPLRLSAHQRVDLRRNIEKGLDYLADTLKNYSGTANVSKPVTQLKTASLDFSKIDTKKLAIPALIVVAGLLLVGGYFLVRELIGVTVDPTKVVVVTPPDVDPIVTNIATEPVVGTDNEPTGKIIYTCEIKGSEVCIMNADGSNWEQLTDSQYASYNATLSPDGKKAVYIISNGEYSEIHELNTDTGSSLQLTDLGKNIGSPEISPDNKYIIFHYQADNGKFELWLMNRDGSSPHKFYNVSGKDVHDATWSPDGNEILFALGKNENNNLYVTDMNGREPRLLNKSIDTRGRSDWGFGDLISLDMGGSWAHDVYLMNADGSNLHQVSPAGINAQGASLSPDGNWVTFSAYTDVADKDLASCEIYIMRVDGSDMRQLTNNSYCDYQPRWGN